MSIHLMYQSIPKGVKAESLNSIVNALVYQVDAHYPSYPAACDPAYPVTFLYVDICLLSFSL